MRNRRFVILVSVLVALNAALLFTPQGLALRQVVVSSLFGKNMVRADVVEKSGAEWRIDRGIVVSAGSSVLTLNEADGRVQPIVVSSSTRVTWAGRTLSVGALKPGWRVLVTWPAPSGPADSVVVEKK
jgi:hypothetical protein